MKAAQLLVDEGIEYADDLQMACEQYAFYPDPWVNGVWAAVHRQEDDLHLLCYVDTGDVEEVQFTSEQLADFGHCAEED